MNRSHKLSCLTGILLCIASSEMCSQLSVVIQPGFNSFGGEMHLMPDNTIRVMSIASDDWWFGMSSVSTAHFSTSGEKLSTTTFSALSLEEGWGSASFTTRKGHTIVAADLTGCDFGVPLTLGCISETNAVVWTVTPFDFGSDISGPEYYVRQVGDTVFRVWSAETPWSPEKAEYYSFNGLQLFPPIEFTLYEKILLTKDGYVMSADATLTLCDTTFTPVALTMFSSGIQAFDTISGGGFICVTHDSLFLLDSTLERINSTPLAQSQIAYAFSTSQDFWLVEATGTFHRLNANLDVIDMYQPDPRISLSDIMHIGDTIFVTANITGRDRSLILMRTTPETFSLDLNTDLGITNIRLTEQATSFNVDWGWPGAFVRDVIYGPVYVTLRNDGTTQINETFLRFQEYACPSFCQGILQYEWLLTNLNLSPGDEREVYLGDLSFQCTNYNIEQLCLYTFNPGNEPDIHFENDLHCVTVDVISDINDITEELPVSIYPNPVSDVLYIDYPGDMDFSNSRLALIDSHGQQVWHSPDDELVSEIRVDHLPSGVYFLLIHARSTLPIMKKIVVI